MLVYIDDREDEEFDGDYGYDYGGEEDYDYDESQEQSYDYVESEEGV
ncbi:MAG: hypothetical protein H8E76_01735 [Helicobacteraceae bacterium]|nr:hypothetical protein [Candidatus Sulfurimonas ponti]